MWLCKNAQPWKDNMQLYAMVVAATRWWLLWYERSARLLGLPSPWRPGRKQISGI